MRTAIAEGGPCRIDALEVGLAGGDLVAEVETIQAMKYTQTMIDGFPLGLELVNTAANLFDLRSLTLEVKVPAELPVLNSQGGFMVQIPRQRLSSGGHPKDDHRLAFCASIAFPDLS